MFKFAKFSPLTQLHDSIVRIQVIVSGDFLQLPPVENKGGFIFDCDAWKRTVHVTVELKQVFRQKDAPFVALLQSIRRGQVRFEWLL